MSNVHPLPNDRVTYNGGREATVFASSHMNDDESVVLLLNPFSPHFTVAYTSENGVRAVDEAKNIVHAVRLYLDYGGDPGGDTDHLGFALQSVDI